MDEGKDVVIGTRGSALALVQAEATRRLLEATFPGICFRQRIIKTTGDRRTDVSLAEVAKAEGTFDKGVFIKELEEALDTGDIDIAVHSLKDMPTVLEERFELAGTLERAPVKDVLLMKVAGGLDGLCEGAIVGTSSVRRARQMQFLRPDVRISDLRGNVPTRIRKLADGQDYDAILLAEAGLVRLGMIPKEGEVECERMRDFPGVFAVRLEEKSFLPAAGQGAIGLEIRSGDGQAGECVAAINHAATWRKVVAEREFLRLLDGGCHTPVGVFCQLEGGRIHMSARVFPEEGGQPKCAKIAGDDPLEAALELYRNLR